MITTTTSPHRGRRWKRRLLWGAILLAVGAIGFFWSFFLFAVFVVAAAVVACFRWSKNWSVLHLALMLLLIATLAGAWRAGVFPSHAGRQSSAESRLPVVEGVLTSLPPGYESASQPPPPDALEQTREALRDAIRKYRAQANVVERALQLKESADGVVAFADNQRQSIDAIVSATNALADAIKAEKLDSLQKLRVVKDDLEKQIQSCELELQKVRTAKDANDLYSDCLLKFNIASVGSINGKVQLLESALREAKRKAIENDIATTVSNHEVTIDESKARITKTYALAFRTKEFSLAALDASELMIESDPELLSQSLTVAFGGEAAPAVPVDDASRILIRPGVTEVRLVRTRVYPARIRDLPSKLRLVQFRYVELRWPNPWKWTIRSIVDLSRAQGQSRYPYAFDIQSDAPIEAVRLPTDSFFASNFAFAPPSREDHEEVLRPLASESLRPSYFLTHQMLWLELMPDNFVFRNAAMRAVKDYLFIENLIAALIVTALGLVITILATRSTPA